MKRRLLAALTALGFALPGLAAEPGAGGYQRPTAANAHALILAIGDYEAPVPKLKGVRHDVDTATQMARRLGVPAENIVTVRDKALDLAGMRRAFDDLAKKLDGDSQVFIYYSGHGGRQSLSEGDAPARCAESLITQDGQAMSDSELESRMKTIASRSHKTVMFIDACHAGGVTTRTGGKSPLFQAKSYTAPERQCTQPTNVLTRNLRLSRLPGSGSGNFVHIAAARDHEISLDQPDKGGVASQAWLACLSGRAVDSDGSGGLSAEEIQRCAQQIIDEQLKNTAGYLPHHVTLNGNAQMILGYVGDSPATAPAPAPVPTPVPAATPTATLNDLYNNRDDRKLVSLEAASRQLRIGQDRLDFTVTSREAGYVYVFMVGSDGVTFDLLFPNQLDPDNRIAAGQRLRLPRADWQLTAEGPPGTDRLLVLVTESPRDFTLAGLRPAGPFSMAGAHAAKALQLVSAAETCRDRPGTTRNLALGRRCASSYGAALLSIEEVR